MIRSRRSHSTALTKPFVGESEREARRAVQQCAELARDAGAERGAVEQRQPVGRRDLEGVRVAEDVVQHVAVVVVDALGSTGRAGREVDVRERVRPDLQLRSGIVPLRLFDHDELRAAGRLVRSRAALRLRHDRRRAAFRDETTESRGGFGRVERHVRPPALQRSQHGSRVRRSLVDDERDRICCSSSCSTMV